MKLGLISALATMTVLALFAFPKAGIYVGEIPITFGYLLLGVTGTLQSVRLAIRGCRQIRFDYVLLGILFFLLAAVEATSFSAYGAHSAGSLMSITASTIAVPILAMLSAHLFVEVLGMQRFLQLLRVSLAIVFVFGVVSFAAYNATGNVIGIPYLTTTGSDIYEVAERCNLRGSLIKMFSTYNNGNILGINLLIWGPLAIAGTRFSVMQFRSICILTLSRSVWIGLATYELIHSIVRRNARKTLYAGAFVMVLFALYVGASWFMGRDPTAFLLDRNLGGRVASFERNLHGIHTQKVGWGNESLYAAAYLAFGWVGAGLIAAIWAVPIIRGGRSWTEIQCRIAMAVYMFVASAEAAFNLIPTQASYWIMAGIALGAGRSTAELSVRGQGRGAWDRRTELTEENSSDPVADRYQRRSA